MLCHYVEAATISPGFYFAKYLILCIILWKSLYFFKTELLQNFQLPGRGGGGFWMYGMRILSILSLDPMANRTYLLALYNYPCLCILHGFDWPMNFP